jgi:hypothetical protein
MTQLGLRALPRVPSHRLCLVLAMAAAAACGEQRITAPGPGRIAITSGDAQRGVPGQPLEFPLVVVVHDRFGAPASGVPVTWVASDGGTIDPAQSVTDAEGTARATWTLGVLRPTHQGHAEAPGYFPVEFSAFTSREGDLPFDVIQPLVLQTFDGSGQTVHPDFVMTGPEWTHDGTYLFVTPYPNGNAAFENPSLYQSADLLRWSAPLGVTNPIQSPHDDGYYSDPDALYVPERNELWLYFRQVSEENVIRLTTSQDGVTWTPSVVVAHAPSHRIISPSVVHRGPNDWLMWAVNGNVGCSGATTTVELRRSTNGREWSIPETVALSQLGVFPWHIDVEWVPSRGEFWALYNGKTAGSCTTGAVYLATSTDGVHWATHPSPVLARGAIPELQDVVYRSTFAYDEASDAITVWFSGARYSAGNYIWSSAVQRRRRADLFAAIDASPPSKAALRAGNVLPQLVNFP